MKKVLVVLFALMITVAFTACGGSDKGSSAAASGSASASAAESAASESAAAPTGETFELKCGTHYNTEHANYKLLEAFAAKVEEDTGGAVTIKLFPSSQLGDYSTMYGDLKSGALDMAMISIASEYDPQFEMNFVPYAASTYEQAKEYLGPDGYFFSEYEQIHAAQNVKLLGIYEEGMIGFGFTKKPENYGDPAAKKNLKVRAPAIEVYADVTQDLGYSSTTINYSDLYTALQTGVCDGWVGGTPQLNWTDFKDVIKYYVPYNCFVENGGLFMSQKCFDSLPAEYQDVVTAAAKELVDASFEQAEANDEECLQNLKDYGIEILELSDDELAACQAQVQADVWPTLYDKFGEDRLNKIKDSIK